MKNIILLLCCFLGKIVFSQNIEGFIKDKATEKSIPFVNITYLNVNVGAVSDTEGYFTLKKIENNNKIQISCLGYETLILDIKDVKNNVYLEPTVEILKEIVLSAEKPKYTKNINLGLEQTLKARTSLPFGYEFSTFIENKYRKKGVLKEIILNLNKSKKYDFLATYNIKFYSYDSINKQPGELIYFENVFIKPENKTYQLKIDIEDLNIKLPAYGICIGVEIVNIENFEINSMSKIAPEINFTHTAKKNISWSRFMNKKWTLSTYESKAKKGQYVNANINITAKIER